MTSSGRSFDAAGRTMIEALASRGTIALDNARLHHAIQEADRRKDDFLAMLAHELRNPLGPVRNAVQYLYLTGAKDAHLLNACAMIDRQVTHMARLVDDLLDATRIAHGKILLRKERCDLARLVRQTAEDFRSIFDGSGLELEVAVPAGPIWVEGDPTRLAQMVGNLLHNAHKFTDPGGRVSVGVTLEPESRSVFIRVRDQGIGITAEMLPHVFEVFTQADRSLARSRGGLGMGLALVKGLAQLHGGEVGAASPGLGQGAEFTIRLPLAAAHLPPPALPLPQCNGKNYRVLVIEDNMDTAESTRMLLSLAGHEVQTAYTGAAGLEAARKFHPQVILCDIGLPGGLNGYDVVRALRQDPTLATGYVIALTGYGRDEDLRQAQEAGFDLHFTKPVDYEHLCRALACLPARG
jgi:CheY-like chemotaxis protein/nitrogen-specific signal transduction histidine kinase